MSRKQYVLDTSVLISDPNCISKFVGNDIIISVAVLEELDALKTRENVSSKARNAIRNIDNYVGENFDNNEGIDIGNGIRLFFDTEHVKNEQFDSGSKDDTILSSMAAHPGSILVSCDINMRLRAKILNFQAQNYLNDVIDTSSGFYTGFRDVELTDYIEGFSLDSGLDSVLDTQFETMYPNEFVQVTCNGKNAIFRRVKNRLKPVRSQYPWDVAPRSREQFALIELLMDPEVAMVSVDGLAGSGKTYIIAAVVLETLIAKKLYQKAHLFKPIVEIGNSLGFLPGSVAEKIEPYMASYYDSFESLLGENYESKLFQYKEKINFEPITYIRGRSINNSILCYDEAQNISSGDIKTICTRVGNSKLIFAGDVSQVDLSYLTKYSNGLSHLIEKFKPYEMTGHITLKKCERSSFASLAASIL
jgi:PhoH-like ATPase